jgi:hypothetical protein
MPSLCEACRVRPVALLERLDESDIPYSLCHSCYHRLVHRSLRPLEYFNLVAIHGLEYELHDDFYDDCGIAYAAEEPVEPDSSLSFPTLSTISDNVGR